MKTISSRTSRAFGLLAATSFFGLAQPSFAQVAENEADQTADAEVRGGGLDIITVTARKRVENVQDVPITIAALSPDRLDQTATRNFADLSAVTPGLQIMSSSVVNPASSFIFLRGFGLTDDLIGFDFPVALYVDNIYNEGVSGSAGRNFFDIDRVEIVKGPQGTLFGRNSVGGAIQIFTKEPTNEFEGKVLAGIGNHGSRRLAGVINTPISDGVSFRLTAEYDKLGGFMRSASTGDRLAGQENYLIRGGLKFEPSDDLTILLRGSYSQINAFGTATRLLALPNTGPAYLSILAEMGAANPFAPTAAEIAAADSAIAANINAPKYVNFADDNGPQVVNSYAGSAEITYDVSSGVTFKSITGYKKLDSRSYTDADATQFALLTAPQQRDLEQFSQEFQLNVSAFDDRLDLVLGGYYFYFKGDEVQQSRALEALLQIVNPTGFTSTTVPNFVRKSPAVFAQGTFEVVPDLNVTAGIRYTSDKQRQVGTGTIYSDYELTNPTGCNVPFDTTLPCEIVLNNKNSAVTWLGSVDYRPVPDVMVYAKVARGFRTGGHTPRLGTAPGTATAFAPEFVTEFEAGFKSELFNNRVRLNVAAYLDKFSDVQTTVPVLLPSGFAVTIQNAGRIDLYGVEMDLDIAPTDNLRFGATFGFADYSFKRVDIFNSATNELVNAADAYRLDNVPKWTYSLFTSYEQPTNFGSISASLNWRWNSRHVLNPSRVKGPETFPTELLGIPGFAVGSSDELQFQDSYGLLGGQLSMKFEDHGLEISLWGKNMLNKFYASQKSDLIRAGLGLITQVVGQSRTFGLEVTKKF